MPFTGWLLVGMALPLNAQGVQYARVNLYGMQPAQQIPTWTMIPIVQGVFNSNATLYFSNMVEPPSTLYAFYFLDATRTQIYPPVGTPPTLVSVETNPYIITPPTLTIPGTPTLVPAPQTSFTTPNGGSPVPSYVIPTKEVLSGVVDGVNTIFTISKFPQQAFAILDGQLQAATGYIFAGNTITFLTPPPVGTLVEALVF